MRPGPPDVRRHSPDPEDGDEEQERDRDDRQSSRLSTVHVPVRSPSVGDAGGESPGTGDESDDLLTDGDRVRRLLAEHDGRVRQSEIAAAFDWSDSKTSRVVSRLAEDGEVEKVRLGRENVISLPDDGQP